MLRESFGKVVGYADVEASRSVREDVDEERAHGEKLALFFEQPSSLSPPEERIVAGARRKCRSLDSLRSLGMTALVIPSEVEGSAPAMATFV